jgi:type I site-specific restriction endonuclease
MPGLDGYDMRPASARSVLAIEKSMTEGHARSLLQMATGAGKTRMAVAPATQAGTWACHP